MEFELAQSPADGITNVTFGPTADNLLASSWDKTLRLYDTSGNGMSIMRSIHTFSGPVLDCSLVDSSHAYCGGLDKTLSGIDLTVDKVDVIGAHDAEIKCVEWADSHGLVLTGGWDSQVKAWDPRQAGTGTAAAAGEKQNRVAAAVQTMGHPDKVYSMSVTGDTLVVGTAGRHVWIWDLRKMDSVQQRRESSLKYQTRCVRAHNGGYVLSSIEGRVAVEVFDTSPEAQARKFAFKCHRAKVDGVDTIYPVNALAFHPVYGTFATGGCDGTVCIWDGGNKKRLDKSRKYPVSIASLAFNSSGTKLAVAASYTFEEGEGDHPPDAIFVRQVGDDETKPKVKK